MLLSLRVVLSARLILLWLQRLRLLMAMRSIRSMWLIDRMDLMASLIRRIFREYSARSCCGESEGNS